MMQMPNTTYNLRQELEHAAKELELAENALACSSFYSRATRAKNAARRARAALAAEQQGPSDEELLSTYRDACQEYWDSPDEKETVLPVMVLRGLRAVLARYGGQQ